MFCANSFFALLAAPSIVPGPLEDWARAGPDQAEESGMRDKHQSLN